MQSGSCSSYQVYINYNTNSLFVKQNTLILNLEKGKSDSNEKISCMTQITFGKQQNIF